MSDEKGSNINKFVKGRESPFLSFLEFSIFLLFLERGKQKFVFLLFQSIMSNYYFHLRVPSNTQM